MPESGTKRRVGIRLEKTPNTLYQPRPGQPAPRPTQQQPTPPPTGTFSRPVRTGNGKILALLLLVVLLGWGGWQFLEPQPEKPVTDAERAQSRVAPKQQREAEEARRQAEAARAAEEQARSDAAERAAQEQAAREAAEREQTERWQRTSGPRRKPAAFADPCGV